MPGVSCAWGFTVFVGGVGEHVALGVGHGRELLGSTGRVNLVGRRRVKMGGAGG